MEIISVNESDNLRLSNRIALSKPKTRIYVRKNYYKSIVKNVVNQKEIINGIDEGIQLNEVESYVNGCRQQELRDFGQSFPYKSFLDYIKKSTDEEKKLTALKILSRVTMSGEASYDFFLSNNLISFCNESINNQKYLPFIFTILINGSQFEDFGNYYLESNICDILLSCPVTNQLSMLVSSLSWFESDYLNKLLETIFYILNDQINKIDSKIDKSICCYALKSLHHIYNWDNIDPSIIDELNEKFAPMFYTLSDLLFKTDDEEFESVDIRILNGIFRYLGHLQDIPIEFGELILSSIKKIKDVDKIKNAKTIKLAMILFINNCKSWIQDYQEELLFNVFSYYQDVPYIVKRTIFEAVSLYYDCTDGVVDQFMSTVIDWCLFFIQDPEVTMDALQKLIKIALAAKNDVTIFSTISSYMNVYENLVISDKTSDEAIALAEDLIDIVKTDD